MAWSYEVSGLNPREFSDAVDENRAWGKRLREGTKALVRARLAKTITNEEYAAERKRSNDEAAECCRRRELLARCEAHRRPIIDPQVIG
jgi:hypothetical protein